MSPRVNRMSATAAHSVAWDRYSLLIDGRRTFVWSGEFHPFRLPSPGLWRFAPFAQFPAIFAAETLRRRVPLVDEAVGAFAQWRPKRWLAARLGVRQAEYKAVEAFTR